MRAVDTKVVLQILVRDDAAQAAAAERFIAEGAWISIPALLDVTWKLRKEYGRSEADVASAVEMLLNHPEVTTQCADAVADAVATFRRHPALGFADCLILALARWSGNLPLGTFDRRLGRLEGAETIR